MLKAITILIFTLLIQLGNAQGFDVDDSVKTIYKSTASSTPPHEYFQLLNPSGQDINMRWKVNTTLTNYPAQWQIAIQDNVTYHNPAPDSSDFILPDTVGGPDKIVINVYHNAYPGYGVYALHLINLDSTDQVIDIRFEITIYYANGIDEKEGLIMHIFPNPTQNVLNLNFNEYLLGNYDLEIIDMKGNKVYNHQVSNCTFYQLDVSSLTTGIYNLLLFNNEKNYLSTKKIIIH